MAGKEEEEVEYEVLFRNEFYPEDAIFGDFLQMVYNPSYPFPVRFFRVTSYDRENKVIRSVAGNLSIEVSDLIAPGSGPYGVLFGTPINPDGKVLAPGTLEIEEDEIHGTVYREMVVYDDEDEPIAQFYEDVDSIDDSPEMRAFIEEGEGDIADLFPSIAVRLKHTEDLTVYAGGNRRERVRALQQFRGLERAQFPPSQDDGGGGTIEELPWRVVIEAVVPKPEETRHEVRLREAREEFESQRAVFPREPEIGEAIQQTTLEMTPQLREFMRRTMTPVERQVVHEQRERLQQEDDEMEALWQQQQQALVRSQIGEDQPTLREWERSFRNKVRDEIAEGIAEGMQDFLVAGATPTQAAIRRVAEEKADEAIDAFRGRPLPGPPEDEPEPKRRRAEAQFTTTEILSVLGQTGNDPEAAAQLLQTLSL